MDQATIIEQLIAAFQPGKASGVSAKIQVKLSGEGAGDYFVLIKDQELAGGEGVIENPRLTLIADSKDLGDIFQGRMDPMSAYFQGRLIILGDLGFAMQLANLFKRGV